MNRSQWRMKSKIGTLYLVASEKGLQGIFFKKQKTAIAKSLSDKKAAVRVLAKAAAQLKEYFDGKRKAFKLPLDAAGTPFQKNVWKALSRIPYGKTYSYKDVADRIRNPKAVRAVGNANGKNPLCIIVPCHRVIANDGSLGGYSAGLGIKVKLLSLEKVYS